MVAPASSFLPAEGITLLKSTALAGSGTHTFNPRTKWLRLFLAAGGGGGGGGSNAVTGSTQALAPVIGGNGGAPGEVLLWEGPVSAFGASAAFACGAGGTGAAGKVTVVTGSNESSDSSNKPSGVTGGDTTFGGLRVKGGPGGTTGTSSIGGSLGGSQTVKAVSYNAFPAMLNANFVPSGGGAAQAGIQPGIVGLGTLNAVDNLFAGGGAGSGAWHHANFTIYDGGNGGSATFSVNSVGGVSSTSANGTNGGNATAGSPLLLSGGGGGAGGGASGHQRGAAGGLAGNRTAGNGGNGSLGGGGGGGGPASAFNGGSGATATGGNGGNGGDGGIAVLEFG